MSRRGRRSLGGGRMRLSLRSMVRRRGRRGRGVVRWGRRRLLLGTLKTVGVIRKLLAERLMF